MNKKQVLANLGSPHANGITAAMLDCAIHRAEKRGYTITKINLYERNLSFCTGCRACLKTKVCIQKDDIQEITDYLHKCQTIFLAAPVYWANVPAAFSWIFGQSSGAIRNMDEFFKTAGMKPIGKIVCANAANKKELPKSLIKKIERCLK